MTTQPPAIPSGWQARVDAMAAESPGFLHGLLAGWFEPDKAGALCVSNKLASYLASLGFVFFLTGRFTGAALLRRFSAHRMLGLYGVMNVLMCLLVFLKLGWASVACVFLSYFFMSIMFPTIFALGIFGLGARAKRASAYIVMAIMGGALLPKAMGFVADRYDMSRGFIVPLGCFVFIAYYGYCWPRLSGAESLGDGGGRMHGRR
jgi:FHS family L-fucose permease-like MFS transporter